MKAQRQESVSTQNTELLSPAPQTLNRSGSVSSSIQRNLSSMRCSISSRCSSISLTDTHSSTASTSIVDAITQKNMRAVQHFLKHHADVDHIMQGKSIMAHAVEAEAPAIARVLVHHGVSIHRENNNGATPASTACDRKQDALLKMFILGGVSANVQFKGQQYDSPLHYASTNNKPDLVKWLIKQGADINSSFRGDMSALKQAQISNDTQLTHWLVKNGAK